MTGPAGGRRPLLRLVDVPVLRRVAWYAGQVRSRVDRRLLLVLGGGIVGTVLLAAIVLTILERDESQPVLGQIGAGFYWGINTVLGSGDPGFVTTVIGGVISWLLTLVGLVLLAIATGLLIGVIIDFVL